MTKKPALKFLGLPFGTRWEEAAKVIKTKLVEARRVDDLELCIQLSMAKAILKRTLRRTCSGCKGPCGIHALKCGNCSPWSNGRPKVQEHRCACGARISENSKRCRDCAYPKKKCACGAQIKSKSDQCLNCYKASRKGHGSRMCACGATKDYNSKQCQKCREKNGWHVNRYGPISKPALSP